MQPTILRRNDLVFYANMVVFVLLFVLKPSGAQVGVAVLGSLLLLSLLLLPQSYSRRHLMTARGSHWNSIALIWLILIAPLVYLHWAEYSVIEQIYLILFCLIQVFLFLVKEEQVLPEGEQEQEPL